MPLLALSTWHALCVKIVYFIKSEKNVFEKGYSTKTVGIPNFFDKITRDMDWHLLIYFQEVLVIYVI